MIKRIISRIDIKNSYLVKGIQLEGLRVLGYPEEFAKKYYEEDIDEVIFQDIVASLYKRNQSKLVAKKITEDIFVPIVVGGGIKTLEDVQDILMHGADRACINTGAIKNPDFIEKSALKFGSSTISIAIETLNIKDHYKVYTDSGRSETNLNLFDWIKKVQDLGAGEIILTAIANEGTSKGFDLGLYEKVSKICKIPLIAHGGAGKPQDVLELFKKVDINGCVIASAFHYFYMNRLKKNKIVLGGSSNFLNNENFDQNNNFGISELKKYLNSNNIKTR
mgnify:CR=1 FL=1